MCTKKQISILALVLFLFQSSKAFAELDLKWSEARFYISDISYAKEQTELNNLSSIDNIEKLTKFTGFGIEADAKYKSWVKLGTRFKYIVNSIYPTGNSSLNSTSYLHLTQLTAGIVARLPIVENNNVSFDLLGEIGLGNNKFELSTAGTGKGTFTKDANFYARAGASVGIGWQSAKFYIEGGYETNSLDDIKYEGNLTNNNPNSINKIDLSGTYTMFGIMINDLPDWLKPGKLFTVGK